MVAQQQRVVRDTLWKVGVTVNKEELVCSRFSVISKMSKNSNSVDRNPDPSLVSRSVGTQIIKRTRSE